MKRLLLTVTMLLSVNFAYGISRETFIDLPRPNYVTSGVYTSTFVYVNGYTADVWKASSTNIIIASFPVILQNIVINEAGSWDAKIEVWDGMRSSNTSAGALLKYKIDASSLTVWNNPLLNDVLSSGCIINQLSTTPSKFTVILRRR